VWFVNNENHAKMIVESRNNNSRMPLTRDTKSPIRPHTTPPTTQPMDEANPSQLAVV
jgi:hypothetical protein